MWSNLFNLAITSFVCTSTVHAFSISDNQLRHSITLHATSSPSQCRKSFFSTVAKSAAGAVPFFVSNPVHAEESLDVENFLRSGGVAMPMGVSGQAGKSRPENGVVLRDGSDVSRNNKSGDVLAEILLDVKSKDPTAVLTSFSSPWPLATGGLFDVECRDSKTGDGAFIAVTSKASGKSIQDLPSSFFLDRIFSSTGRFSFYGSPTDIKVKKSYSVESYRFIELSFSTLSQSTQTEIPRNAILVASIPPGTDEAVMMVGSATATRWRKAGAEDTVRKTADSFRVVPSPKSKLKVRAKDRSNFNLGESF